MSLNVELLRSSFDLVVEREPELTARFYERLFSDYPQSKPLFGRKFEREQQKMLQDALIAVVDHLEDADWLVGTLQPLGRKHVGYGVTAVMYDWVGASLLVTLAQAAGDDWTREHEAAWAEAYGAIAGIMQS